LDRPRILTSCQRRPDVTVVTEFTNGWLRWLTVPAGTMITESSAGLVRFCCGLAAPGV